MRGGVLWNFGEGEARGMERETGERKGGREELYINGSGLIIYFLLLLCDFLLLFGNFMLFLCGFLEILY